MVEIRTIFDAGQSIAWYLILASYFYILILLNKNILAVYSNIILYIDPSTVQHLKISSVKLTLLHFSVLGGLEIPSLPLTKCCRHFPKFRAAVYRFLLRKAFPTIFHRHSGHPASHALSYAVERKRSPKVVHQMPRAVSPNPVLRD